MQLLSRYSRLIERKVDIVEVTNVIVWILTWVASKLPRILYHLEHNGLNFEPDILAKHSVGDSGVKIM